jgi:hypothetical protein
VHIKKGYGGVNTELHSFLISELQPHEWSDSHPGLFTSQERAQCYSDPIPGHFEERKNLPLLRPTQLTIQWAPGHSHGGKAATVWH